MIVECEIETYEGLEVFRRRRDLSRDRIHASRVLKASVLDTVERSCDAEGDRDEEPESHEGCDGACEVAGM